MSALGQSMEIVMLAPAAAETEAVVAWKLVRRANFHRAGLCLAGAGEKATRISPYTEDFSVSAISNSSASSFELWQAGSYEVEAELFGCPIKDSFALEVNDCRSRIYFPTAFSPNGDGLNDLFLPQGKDYEGIELQVYDRWGGLLFSSQSPSFAWDGGDAAGGLYVYRFRYFNTPALQEEEVSGQVVLLR